MPETMQRGRGRGLARPNVAGSSRVAMPSEPQNGPTIYAPNFQRPIMAAEGEFPFLVTTETNPIIVPASGSVTDSFLIDGSSAFLLETIRSTHPQPYRVLLSIGTGSARLMNKPVHVDNLCGTAQRPGYWSQVDWLMARGERTVIIAEFFNLSTTVSNTIEIVLAGRRQMVDPDLHRTPGSMSG
jgi:hypothetical protein